jgi:hypothetical protein
MVTVLCCEYAAEALDESLGAANRLLIIENAEHPHDRRSLFICSECGDLGCGATSCAIVKEGNAIVWKEFGFQNNCQDVVARKCHTAIGPSVFDFTSNESVLLRAIGSLSLKEGM